MNIVDKIINNDFVSVLKGSYHLTNPENTASMGMKLPKGVGYMVVNLGEVELGDAAKVKLEIRKALEELLESK